MVALPAATGFGVWFADTYDQVVVAVAGEIDMVTAPKLWEALAQALGHDGPIEIDLAGVTFMDCQGLAVLVRAYKSRRCDDGRLVLRSPQPIVRKLFELTKLDEGFEIED